MRLRRWLLGVPLAVGVAFFACSGPAPSDGSDVDGGSVAPEGAPPPLPMADGATPADGGDDTGATDGDAGDADAGDASDGSIPVVPFGDGGEILDPVGNAFAVQTDGTAIYVGGQRTASTVWTIEKRDSSGALITGFGDGGVVSLGQPGSSVQTLAIDATSLYVGGYEQAQGSPIVGDDQWLVEKRDRVTGALVTAFGTGGAVTANPNNQQDHVEAIVLDGGYLYIGGWTNPGAQINARWRIEKRDATTGAPVTAFGTSGAVDVPAPGPVGTARGTAMVVTGGSLYCAWGGRIEKRDPTTGNLDPTFGTAGVVTANAYLDALVTDGAALFAGGFATGGYWHVEQRSLIDGTPVATFGDAGAADESTSGLVFGLVVAKPYLYVLGGDNGASDDLRVEKRLATSSALVPSFADAGVFVRSNGISGANANAGTIAGPHLVVVGNAGPDWLVEGMTP